MNNPEVHQWREGVGHGSATFFGKVLEGTRRFYEKDIPTWASLGGVEIGRYIRLEQGEEPTPPKLEELDGWTKGWRLDRDEILDLKQYGGYPINAYLKPLSTETFAKALTQTITDSPFG